MIKQNKKAQAGATLAMIFSILAIFLILFIFYLLAIPASGNLIKQKAIQITSQISERNQQEISLEAFFQTKVGEEKNIALIRDATQNNQPLAGINTQANELLSKIYSKAIFNLPSLSSEILYIYTSKGIININLKIEEK